MTIKTPEKAYRLANQDGSNGEKCKTSIIFSSVSPRGSDFESSFEQLMLQGLPHELHFSTKFTH
jgi:hypothetical protein